MDGSTPAQEMPAYADPRTYRMRFTNPAPVPLPPSPSHLSGPIPFLRTTSSRWVGGADSQANNKDGVCPPEDPRSPVGLGGCALLLVSPRGPNKSIHFAPAASDPSKPPGSSFPILAPCASPSEFCARDRACLCCSRSSMFDLGSRLHVPFLPSAPTLSPHSSSTSECLAFCELAYILRLAGPFGPRRWSALSIAAAIAS
jgi:hypothetical protein